jgi:hypothetical protein
MPLRFATTERTLQFPYNGAPAEASDSLSATETSDPAFVPRFLRLRDAPRYLGMDKNRFNREVRPSVLAVRVGIQGIAFDRIDLDAWADEYKSRNGCHAARSHRSMLWEPKKRQASPSAVGFGTSIRCTEERAFAKALAQAKSARPKNF